MKKEHQTAKETLEKLDGLNGEQRTQYLRERSILLEEQQYQLEKHLELRVLDAEKLKENKDRVIEFKVHDHNKNQEKRYTKIWQDVAGIRWDHVTILPPKSKEVCLNCMILSYNHILRELTNAKVISDQDIKEMKSIKGEI